MLLTHQLAKNTRGVYFGGNWTAVNLKDTLADVTLQQAIQKIEGMNSILSLAYHIGYFTSGTNDVLRGGPLEIRDKFSFDHPAIDTETAWRAFVDHTLAEGEVFASLLEKLPEGQLLEDFTDSKYGTYQTNLLGTIEHVHYHLGQIVVLKRLIQAAS
ncbi:MAG: DinB family protein [Saprospiraceae bacterium]